MDLKILKFFIALHSLLEAIVEIMMMQLTLSERDRDKLVLRLSNLTRALDQWRAPDGG